VAISILPDDQLILVRSATAPPCRLMHRSRAITAINRSTAINRDQLNPISNLEVEGRHATPAAPKGPTFLSGSVLKTAVMTHQGSSAL
jgi:hypothetical protein